MKKIAFRDSITSKLLLAIIAFPALLTLSGFFIFQKVGHQRIVEFSDIKMHQLEQFNATLLLHEINSFKEKAIRIASDNQIIVPYKLKVDFQLKAYLEQLLALDKLCTLAVLSPNGVSDTIVGHHLSGYRLDFGKTQKTTFSGKSNSSVIKRVDREDQSFLCLVAATPILSGKEVIATLLVAKEIELVAPFSKTLLVSGNRVQSESVGSSFLLPYVDRAAIKNEFGPLSKPGKPMVVSKAAIQGLKDPDSYFLCGIDERAAFDQNRKIFISGIIISIGILLSLSGYSVYLSGRLTSPLLNMVNAADRIAKGNFQQRLSISSKDEIGHLSQSFNRMMESLAEAEMALKQASRRLLLIMDGIPADIYVADMQTYEILFMNRAMQKNFGRDMTGHICYAAFRKEDTPCDHCTNDKLLDTDGKPGPIEIWECTNPISKISYINYDRAIEWIDGRIVRLQIATDVSARIKAEDALKQINDELEEIVKIRTTELKRTNSELRNEIQEKMLKEEALRQAKAASDHANLAKSEFLANMSHELRTPLNHIIGFTELVVGRNFGELNQQQEEFLKDVLGSSNHLLSLINDILDLSKVEAGKMELQLSVVRIKEMLENSLVMIKEKALKQNIKLSVILDEAPEVIHADERKLKQVVYNLLSNAVKFTPENGKVVLGAKLSEKPEFIDKSAPVEANGNWLSVWVSDTGIGISQRDTERIFEPFEQVEHSKSRKYQGTGLGLALTRRMVELHSGTMWVTSKGTNLGSTFNFAIPLYKDLETGIKAQSPSAGSNGSTLNSAAPGATPPA